MRVQLRVLLPPRVTTQSTTLLISSLVLIASAMSGCSGSSEPPSPSALSQAESSITTPAKPVADVVISNYSYAVRGPVRPGQQVTVVNDDDASHSVVADANDAFDIRISGGGGIATFRAPAVAGTYPFHCNYHANMRGSLTVQ